MFSMLLEYCFLKSQCYKASLFEKMKIKEQKLILMTGGERQTRETLVGWQLGFFLYFSGVGEEFLIFHLAPQIGSNKSSLEKSLLRRDSRIQALQQIRIMFNRGLSKTIEIILSNRKNVYLYKSWHKLKAHVSGLEKQKKRIEIKVWALFKWKMFFETTYNNIRNNFKRHGPSIKYAQYTIQQRVQLVNLVLENGLSINQAATEIGIKPSTAKLIVRKYRTEGTFTMKKSRPAPEDASAPLQRPEIQNEPNESNNEELIIPSSSRCYQTPERPQNFLYSLESTFYPFWPYQFYYFRPNI